MSILRERPFELLRKQSGEDFSATTIRNWYVARTFVLQKLATIAAEHAFAPNDSEHLHVVLKSDDERMLAVARSVALYAHFLNFNEEGQAGSPEHRTVITIVSNRPDIKDVLQQEEYLCNLPRYCKYVDTARAEYLRPDSYIDIELRIVPSHASHANDGVVVCIEKDEVDQYFSQVADDDESIFAIDTRKAFYADQMYDIGAAIDNLPAENIHNAKRYTMALNVYQFVQLKKQPKPMFAEHLPNQAKLKARISNIFCADCFELRAAAMRHLGKNSTDRSTLWEMHNEVLSNSEHARWNVEKLILGYRPFSCEEHYAYQKIRAQRDCGPKLKHFRDSLKNNSQILAHIDLCSLNDLRRINPADLKYDSFLMLTISKILAKLKEYENLPR